MFFTFYSPEDLSASPFLKDNTSEASAHFFDFFSPETEPPEGAQPGQQLDFSQGAPPPDFLTTRTIR